MTHREGNNRGDAVKFILFALYLGLAIILATASGYQGGRRDAEAQRNPCPVCPNIPTPGMTATPEPPKFQIMKMRFGAPTIPDIDPAFWQMLTPEGQAVLARVTLIVSDEPRSYACPQVWEVGGPTPTPATCTYYGGVYDGATNAIGLWGEAAQANPDILRHEALHALDAAGGQPASETAFQKLAGGDLAISAEVLYTAGGGTWFRRGELYAMVPLVVDWHFDQLPPGVASYYAAWFVAAEAASLEVLLP